MNTCYIVGALDSGCALRPEKGDFIIAADAGYALLRRHGLSPDLVVGDFDSLGSVPEGENVIRHPVMKDDTDTMLAVRIGLERGYRTFLIYGGLGGRTDHTFANIQTLAYIANRGGIAFLIGGGENITAVKNGGLRFRAGLSGNISVLALGGEARCVTLSGLLYPLSEATLAPDFPLGVSNEFTGAEAEVTVGEGLLTVIWSGAFERPELL